MILMYDLLDNYIMEFKSYKECAKYFDTSENSIHCYFFKSKKGIVDKKRDKVNHRWVRLFKEVD